MTIFIVNGFKFNLHYAVKAAINETQIMLKALSRFGE